jgi:amino acid adenylation domain-containing protein
MRESVLDGVDEWTAKAPDDVAVLCGDRSLTYRELDQRANQLARALRSAGAGVETVVGLVLPRGVDMAVALLAVVKAGAAYLPLEPEYPDQRIFAALGDSGAVAVVTGRTMADRLGPADVAVVTPDAAAEWSTDPLDRSTGPDNLLYVIHTSGSTGRPKGIAMPHRQQVTLLEWSRDRYAERPVALQYFPITADVASLELLSAWWSGGRVVIATERDRYDVASIVRLVREHEVTKVLLPVVAMQQLAVHAARRPEDVRSLRELITTGDRLVITPELRLMCERLPGAHLDDHYGSTELNVVTAPRHIAPAAGWPAHPPVGTPIVDARIYVLDERLRPVPPNVPGEIHVGGGPPARGYLARGALTAAAFLPDPFSPIPGGRMYRTGDLGRWRPGGVLECLGRVDFQIKSRGHRIEPGEIEALLTARNDVRAAVVALVSGGPGEEGLLAAYVVPAELPDGRVLHTEDLRDHLTARLPAHHVPQAFVLLDELPMTGTGKVDRLRLPDPDEVEPAFVAARDEVEETIVEVWAEALGVDTVGIRHNFFWLGGHSLLVARVTYELRDALGVDLPLATIFQRPTVESFAVEARRLLTEEVTA